MLLLEVFDPLIRLLAAFRHFVQMLLILLFHLNFLLHILFFLHLFLRIRQWHAELLAPLGQHGNHLLSQIIVQLGFLDYVRQVLGLPQLSNFLCQFLYGLDLLLNLLLDFCPLQDFFVEVLALKLFFPFRRRNLAGINYARCEIRHGPFGQFLIFEFLAFHYLIRRLLGPLIRSSYHLFHNFILVRNAVERYKL